MTTTKAVDCVDPRERFSFGENWLDFLGILDEQRILDAERSLKTLCGTESLHGKRFVDVGSGSGLSSLAARRLGATVHSFDYDLQSVAGTQKLKDRFFPQDKSWTVEHGSILDRSYLASLGSFDIVYSWGVLHHTGAMVEAIKNASALVNPSGMLVVALYRKTALCGFWKWEKRWYASASERAQRAAREVFVCLMRLVFFVTRRDFRSYVKNYRSNRGMSYRHDVHDWLGGYPYESITPDAVDALLREHGFSLVRSNVGGFSLGLFGSGCDEYAYRRNAASL